MFINLIMIIFVVLYILIFINGMRLQEERVNDIVEGNIRDINYHISNLTKAFKIMTDDQKEKYEREDKAISVEGSIANVYDENDNIVVELSYSNKESIFCYISKDNNDVEIEVSPKYSYNMKGFLKFKDSKILLTNCEVKRYRVIH